MILCGRTACAHTKSMVSDIRDLLFNKIPGFAWRGSWDFIGILFYGKPLTVRDFHTKSRRAKISQVNLSAILRGIDVSEFSGRSRTEIMAIYCAIG
jgi:hypothetical protein